MKKRSSKKDEYFQTLRVQNNSLSSPSPTKTPFPRQSTCTHFRKQKPLVQLPKIFTIHNSVKHKRYIESLLLKDDGSLNLVGTRFHHRSSRQKRGNEQETTSGEVKRDRGMLEKQQSHKNNFLQNLLNSNGISRIKFAKKEKLRVFIDEGNNSRLVNQLIRHRANLRIVNTRKDANIVWTQFCDWQQSKEGSVFSQFTKSQRQFSTVYSEFQGDSTGCRTEQMERINRKGRLKQINVTKLSMHNHLRNHFEISDKKCLFKNIKRYCKAEKINEQEIIPRTYHIEGSLAGLPEDISSKGEIWIVKPGEDTNRGTGITVQAGRQNIVAAVRELAACGKSALVQQYIDPLLYKGRKFDIRSYALVTCYAGQLRAYWYKQGYLRTCSRQFNYDPLNVFGHLTNDAVQKRHRDYGRYQQCNKLSYNELQVLLKSKDINYEGVLQRMKQLAVMSIRSAQQSLRGDKNMFAFQIFGYDFLIDSKGKVWLIEINTNPCLQFAGSLLSRVIWHMVQNSFAIAIDPLLLQLPQVHNSWQEKMGKIYENNKFQCII